MVGCVHSHGLQGAAACGMLINCTHPAVKWPCMLSCACCSFNCGLNLVTAAVQSSFLAEKNARLPPRGVRQLWLFAFIKLKQAVADFASPLFCSTLAFSMAVVQAVNSAVCAHIAVLCIDMTSLCRVVCTCMQYCIAVGRHAHLLFVSGISCVYMLFNAHMLTCRDVFACHYFPPVQRACLLGFTIYHMYFRVRPAYLSRCHLQGG